MIEQCPPEYVELINKYLIKPEHKLMSNRKLAQLIISQTKLKKTTPDVLRQYISIYKKQSKSLQKVESDVVDMGAFPELKCLHKETPVFVFDKADNNVLLISDLHIPYHSNSAIKTALRYGKAKEVNTVIINGDGIDCYSLSRWQRDPKYRDFHTELEVMREFIRNLRKYFGNDVRIVYKFGNHEDRYISKLWDAIPEFAGDPELSLENRLNFEQYGIEYVASKQRMQLGKLTLIHGHEYFGGSGGQVNHARNYLLKAFSNVSFGHFHRTQDYIQRAISGNIVGAYAIGCLCALTPDYFPFNNWNHGFGHITINDDGHFRFNNKKIIGEDIY